MPLTPFEFDPAVLRQMISHYLKVVARVSEALGIPIGDLRFSTRELGRAFKEAEVDIGALMGRRQTQLKGLSPGKIAGVVAFRLGRYKILTLRNEPPPESEAYMLPELAGVVFAVDWFVDRRTPPTYVRELAYQLARRHANQETLGVCFDTVFACCPPFPPSSRSST